MEEEIERKIEDKIEEKAEKIIEGEDDNSKLGELIEKKVEEVEKEEEAGDEAWNPVDSITRRKFLKMIGLGAGGLAISSQAAAGFLSLDQSGSGGGGGGSSQTLSEVLSEGNDISGTDIVDGGTTVWDTSNTHVPQNVIEQGSGSGLNADTVDGNEASDLGGRSSPAFLQATSTYTSTTGSAPTTTFTYTVPHPSSITGSVFLKNRWHHTGAGNPSATLYVSVNSSSITYTQKQLTSSTDSTSVTTQISWSGGDQLQFKLDATTGLYGEDLYFSFAG